MKTLITQVGSYLTGDAVADAVVQYWLALAEERRADIIDIPVVGSDGRRSHVRLALGATLPIAVVDADPIDGYDDHDAARILLARIPSLSPDGGTAFDPGDLSGVHDEWDSFSA